MKKRNLVLIAVFAVFLCLGIAAFSASSWAAYAESEAPPAVEQEQTEQEEDGGFTELFNDKILPLLITAGTVAAGLLFMGFKDFISKRGIMRKLAAAKELYERAHGRNEVLERENEALKVAAGQVDYSGMIKDLAEKVFGEKFRRYDKTFADMDVNLKAQMEQFSAFMKAAGVVWGKYPEALAALKELPQVRVLNKLALENSLLRDKITEIKGAEADNILASVSSDAEKRV